MRWKKLSYEKYARLVWLLRTRDGDFAGCIGAEYFMMMEEGNPEFQDELMENWFKIIRA